MSKLLADSKKESIRQKEANQKFQERISELEEEVQILNEKLKSQEALWIKAFDINSPKNKKRSANVSFSPSVAVPNQRTGKNQPQSMERGKLKANYKQNMKTMIHQKYIKKLEDQQKRHEREMNRLRFDFATQIEELTEQAAEISNNMIDVQMDSAMKCRSMFDIILEKDIVIEELE
jgi:hypothetical protein